jgi:hypothetical protein
VLVNKVRGTSDMKCQPFPSLSLFANCILLCGGSSTVHTSSTVQPLPDALLTMSEGVLHITDSRTSKSYDIPIHRNSITAASIKAIVGPQAASNPADKVEDGLRLFDPGLNNTAILESKITWVLVSLARFTSFDLIYIGSSIFRFIGPFRGRGRERL